MDLATRSFIVLTDLDGTLLGHHDYGFEAARPWLRRLRDAGIPVVPSTSKTRAEIVELQRTLHLEGAPFIAENGAVVSIPALDVPSFGDPTRNDAARIAAILKGVRAAGGYRFTTFAEAGNDAVAAWTGLSLPAAALARQREASAVLQWESDHGAKAFRADLARHGLSLLAGGRFWHVLDAGRDKGDAARRVVNAHRSTSETATISIGLGDAANDTAMLDAVDIAIIVRGFGPAPGPLRDDRPDRVYRTTSTAPEGWAEGLDHVLGHVLPRDTRREPSPDHARSLG